MYSSKKTYLWSLCAAILCIVSCLTFTQSAHAYKIGHDTAGQQATQTPASTTLSPYKEPPHAIQVVGMSEFPSGAVLKSGNKYSYKWVIKPLHSLPKELTVKPLFKYGGHHGQRFVVDQYLVRKVGLNLEVSINFTAMASDGAGLNTPFSIMLGLADATKPYAQFYLDPLFLEYVVSDTGSYTGSAAFPGLKPWKQLDNVLTYRGDLPESIKDESPVTGGTNQTKSWTFEMGKNSVLWSNMEVVPIWDVTGTFTPIMTGVDTVAPGQTGEAKAIFTSAKISPHNRGPMREYMQEVFGICQQNTGICYSEVLTLIYLPVK